MMRPRLNQDARFLVKIKMLGFKSKSRHLLCFQDQDIYFKMNTRLKHVLRFTNIH